MDRREFVKTATGATAGLMLSNNLALGKEATKRVSKRPNVILIVSDNQNPNTIAALGNRYIKTPNLDRLVKEGLAFNNAYFMGSTMGATCMPSRTMLMTGRTLLNIPLDRLERCEEQAAADPITGIANLPLTLKEAGYNTMRTGKSGNYPLFVAEEFHKNIIVSRSENGSERHADNAIEFLGNQTPENPFFLYVAFAAPNDPHVGTGTAPKKYIDMYKPGDVPAPPNFLPEHPFDNGELRIRDEQLAPWPRTKKVIEEHLAGYHSVITYMDHQIGRVLEALEKTGQYDNTIVIFASDTGTAIGSHGLMGMQNLYEHSVGVPLVFSGPGIPEGETSDALVYLFDVFPTICDLAGLEIPVGVDGKTLGPVMRHKAEKVRDLVFTTYKNVQRAVRDERWKLIRYPQVNETQLFDLKNDPHEINDLAEDPAHSAKVKEMTAHLRKWQRKLGDNVPLS